MSKESKYLNKSFTDKICSPSSELSVSHNHWAHTPQQI